MKAIPAILVIDDNADARNTLAHLLSALGADHVSQAASAEEALEVLAAQSFNLIIADYWLEGMDGVQFLEKLRDRGDNTPVLMLSGAPDVEGVLRATKLVNVDFFSKPFHIAELVQAMERLALAA